MTQPTIAQLMDQAVRHHQAGRLQQAEQLYRQILASQPQHPEALHLLGVLAHQVGQNQTALELIGQAIQIKPTAADFHCNLGNVYQQLNHVDQAIAAFENAIALRPNFLEAINNLANALMLADRLDEAIVAARDAIKLNSKYPQAYNTLGSALRKKGLYDESITALRKALSLKPNYAEAFNNLGNAYRDTDQFSLAVKAYQSALSLKPQLPEIHNNLAGAYEQTGQYEQAIEIYRQGAAMPAASAEVHVNLGIALLRAGKFDQGWREYEWRWKGKDFQRNFTQPEWTGQPLTGQRILIQTEQGLGDTIQFARYLPMLAVRGARTILQCQKELTGLLKQMDCIDAIVAQEDATPDFDLHCALLSLPRIFGTALEIIPASVPYLRADPQLSAEWHDRICANQSHKRQIGLIWAGRAEHKNDRNRSMRLADFAPLASVQGIQLHSLQKGPAVEQLKNAPPGLNIIDWSEDLHDLSDTAAAMQNLDLILSVDTAPVHLAGALGKPVWILLPFVPDWRWLSDRDDSPWYPTMKLLRQPRIGDWSAVIQEVIRRLPES